MTIYAPNTVFTESLEKERSDDIIDGFDPMPRPVAFGESYPKKYSFACLASGHIAMRSEAEVTTVKE